MDITKEWVRSEFVNQEMVNRHRCIETELTFYDAIASGNIDIVTENCKNKMFINPEGVGRLSTNPLQNMRYHFIVTTAMIVRCCVHYGMEFEKAYSLSDFYILKMDAMTSIEEICAIHDVMCIDICNQMRNLRKSNVLSKPVVLCIDYIYSHIHQRLKTKELAEHLGLSVSYLSKLFKQEMGISLSEYIIELKIDKAKNLLQYSDFKIIDIANYLAFASQSHFIQVFNKITGMTPFVYRKRNFRSTWAASQPNLPDHF